MKIDLIEQIRIRRGLTQAEFAESIAYTVTGYKKMIRNGDVKVSVLEKIAEVYDVNILTFFGTKGHKKVGAVAEEAAPYSENCAEVRRMNEFYKSQNDAHLTSIAAQSQLIQLLTEQLEDLKNNNKSLPHAHSKNKG